MLRKTVFQLECGATMEMTNVGKKYEGNVKILK